MINVEKTSVLQGRLIIMSKFQGLDRELDVACDSVDSGIQQLCLSYSGKAGNSGDDDGSY